MNEKEFRKSLVKIMPGYKWTVHRTASPKRLSATGIQSSGSNRLSTLKVTCFEVADGVFAYESKSAGFGTKSPWVHSNRDGTLARALRGLQDHYQRQANEYRSLAARLQNGRAALDRKEEGT